MAALRIGRGRRTFRYPILPPSRCKVWIPAPRFAVFQPAYKTTPGWTPPGGEASMAGNDNVVRIAALADIHYGRTSATPLVPVLERASQEADVLLLCGDLTDHGLPDEARALARELSAAARVPLIAVLGNHDFHNGKQDELGR